MFICHIHNNRQLLLGNENLTLRLFKIKRGYIYNIYKIQNIKCEICKKMSCAEIVNIAGRYGY